LYPQGDGVHGGGGEMGMGNYTRLLPYPLADRG
jgi:hypothetical protein